MIWKFDQHNVLPQDFFARPTLTVARELLGKYIAVRDRRRVTAGRIVEAEAYVGEDDPACHAHRGQTPRNGIMYGPPGFAYVYFTYGNHFMLNLVTEPEGFPAAVLIRALEPTAGIRWMLERRGVDDTSRLCRGPGNLTAALGIGRSFNGVSLAGPRLFVCGKGEPIPTIASSGRIGVNEGSDRPWRFYVPDHPGVSAYRMGTKARRREPAMPAQRRDGESTS